MDTEHFFRCIQPPGTRIEIRLEDALREQSPGQVQVSHCCFYAPTDKISWEKIELKAFIMMQMRFDGMLGFPGGVLDPGEDPVSAVNRESLEEMNLDLDKLSVKNQDFLFALHDEKQTSFFFAKKLTEDQFAVAERRAMKAEHYGSEVLGNFRVPLHTRKNSTEGLPSFLTNCFIDCAKFQLLYSLYLLDILPPEDIAKAYRLCHDME